MKTDEGSSQTQPSPDTQQRLESVWRRRADRLARRPVLEEAARDGRQVIVLGIGDERYGIDFPDVAEVLPPVLVTPVPGAAALFAGVVNLRGEIRPVIDLRTLLGIGAATGNGNGSRVILLRRDGREMGLRADTVERIGWIRAGDKESAAGGETGVPGAESINEDAASRRRLSKYVATSTSDLLMLLSTEALFAELDTGVTT